MSSGLSLYSHYPHSSTIKTLSSLICLLSPHLSDPLASFLSSLDPWIVSFIALVSVPSSPAISSYFWPAYFAGFQPWNNPTTCLLQFSIRLVKTIEEKVQSKPNWLYYEFVLIHLKETSTLLLMPVLYLAINLSQTSFLSLNSPPSLLLFLKHDLASYLIKDLFPHLPYTPSSLNMSLCVQH